MDSAERAWIEVRVDGVERWRLAVDDEDEAAVVARSMLEQWPDSLIEVVRCAAHGGASDTLLVMRHAPPDEPEEPHDGA